MQRVALTGICERERRRNAALGGSLARRTWSALAERVDDEVDKFPHLRGYVVSRRIVDVERKSFVRPVGKQIDQRAAAEVMLEPKVDDLCHAETGQACAQ